MLSLKKSLCHLYTWIFFFRLLKQREKQRDAAAQIRSINNRTTPEGTLASKVYNIPSPPRNSINSPPPTWDNRGGTHPPPGRMPVFYHSSGGQHYYEEAEDVSHHMSHQPVSENSKKMQFIGPDINVCTHFFSLFRELNII